MAVGVAVGVAAGVAVGVAVGVPVGVGPAWATADQTVTASATITNGPTMERRIVAFDTGLLLHLRDTNGGKPPHVGAVALEIYPIGPALGKDVKLFLKLYFVIYMCFQRCFLDT